jgi:hypothetical protein
MRSFSVLPCAGLLLKKPFANYLPTFRASQYKRNRDFSGSSLSTPSPTSKQVGMTPRETALVRIARAFFSQVDYFRIARDGETIPGNFKSCWYGSHAEAP